MRRSVVLGFGASIGGCGILAVALAALGIQFDEARLVRDELAREVSTLRSRLSTMEHEHRDREAERRLLERERHQLTMRVREQLKTIERLKGELEHTRHHVQASRATILPSSSATATQ